MKKTIRTLSMVMMTLAMALCFLFAGLAFVGTSVLAEVDQSAIDTAAVYIGSLEEGDANETGIKFTAKIKKTDYYALTGGTDAEGNTEVHLGVEVVRAKADGTYTILPNAHYTVNTTGALQTYNVGGVKLDDYFMYSFTIKYNLDRIFGEDFKAEDTTIANNINFMYSDELCIRPFYQVISEVDGKSQISDPVYGDYGASRSMIHVAMAEYADANSSLSPEEKETFISKYVSYIEEETAIDVYADGFTDIALDSSIKTYTIGTSAKVVARGTGAIDPSVLEGFTVGEEFYLYGYTADRRVYPYKATYKGFTGISTTAVEDEFVLDESGKLYLNNTQFAGKEIESLFYSDGNLLEKATITESVGKKIANGLVARIGGVYYNLKNVLYVTKAFENTRESRLDMVAEFSGGGRATSSYLPGQKINSRTLTGYYVLMENITFDHSNVPTRGNEKPFDVSGTSNEFFGNNSSNTNIFNATLDGRGYSINNVMIVGSSMFGNLEKTATIKNVAFCGFNQATRRSMPYLDEAGNITDPEGNVVYTKTIIDGETAFVDTNGNVKGKKGAYTPDYDLANTDALRKYYYYAMNLGAGTGAWFFYDVTQATAKLDFENVYIRDDKAGENAYSALIVYSPHVTKVEGVKDDVPVYYQTYTIGQLNFNQVIIENASGPVFSGSNTRSYVGIEDTSFKDPVDGAALSKIAESDVVKDTYVISSSSLVRNCANPEANSEGDMFHKYKTYEAMKADKNDYSNFSSAYWTIVNGVPVWNNASVIPTLKDGETAVTAIDSNEADKEYKLETVVCGKAGDVSKITVSGAENLVDYANGIITVKQFAGGEATLTILYDGAVVTTYVVSVNTLPVATLTGSAGVVDAIDSTITCDTYTITAMAGGKDVTAQIELSVSEDSDDIVIIDNVNKKIIIKQNVEGTATITATVGGVEFTYSVSVDTKAVVSVNDGAVANVTSTTADETFTVTATAGGDVAVELAKEDDNEVITIRDNVVTVNEKAMGTATVIVKIADTETEIARFDVTVDTKPYETTITDEIIFSAYDGFFHTKGIKDIEGAEFISVKYGETELVVDDNVDASAITDVEAGSLITLNVKTSVGNKYALKVRYYDGAFGQDNLESLIALFKGTEGDRLTGTYILTENIDFYDAENGTFYGAFEDSNVIFDCTFDGQGYSLRNVNLHNVGGAAFEGMFGTLPGPEAALKNFAIDGVYLDGALNGDYCGLLFGGSGAADDGFDNKVEMSNVYIYRRVEIESNVQQCAFLAYYNTGMLEFNMTNVIMILDVAEGVDKSINIARSKPLGEATDTYVLANSRASLSAGGSTSYRNGPAGTRYYGSSNDIDVSAAKLAMAADYAAGTINYNTFNTKYWNIQNGIPVWNSITTYAFATNDTTKVVSNEINATAVGTYSVKAFENGVEIETGVSYELTGEEVATFENGVITVLNNKFGDATLNVMYNEVVVDTIIIKVDTRIADGIEKEILISKLDNRIFANGTALGDDLAREGVTIVSLKYDQTELVVNGALDFSSIAQIEGNTKLAGIIAETNNGKLYTLNNVMVYDGVFDNTLASKQLMSTTFGTANSGKKVAKLEGYFVLADNITFYDANDTTTDYTTMLFGGSTTYGLQLFDGTFDGRGYTMNNVILDHSGSYCYGIFAGTMGPNTVLKNFAIDGIYFYKGGVMYDAPKSSYYSVFFSNPAYPSGYPNYTGGYDAVEGDGIVSKTEMSNVFIRARLSAGKYFRLFYNVKSSVYMPVYTVDDKGNGKYSGVLSFGFSKFENVYIDCLRTDSPTTRVTCYLLDNANIGTDNTDGKLGVNFSNTYFVINGYSWGSVHNTTKLTGFDGLERYLNSDAMAAAYTEGKYASMTETGFWRVENGLPVWNTLTVTPAETPAE